MVVDRLGRELSVGDEVLLLQVPVIGDHEFIIGKVLQFTPKKVKIETKVKGRWSRKDPEVTTVLRYGDQLIKI